MLVVPLMFGGVAVSAVIPFLFGRYELRVARILNSPSLMAAGKEFQVHILSSGVVFAVLVGQLLGWPLDRVIAVVIAIFVGRMSWKLLADGMRGLFDASLDPEIFNEVRQIIEAEPTVENARVLGRSAGRYRFIEAEVTSKVTELERAHAISSSSIEEKIRTQIPYVEQVIIHYEPVTRRQIKYAIPLANLTGSMNDEFGTALYFALVTVRVSDGALERVEILTIKTSHSARAE